MPPPLSRFLPPFYKKPPTKKPNPLDHIQRAGITFYE